MLSSAAVVGRSGELERETTEPPVTDAAEEDLGDEAGPPVLTEDVVLIPKAESTCKSREAPPSIPVSGLVEAEIFNSGTERESESRNPT